MTFHTQDSSFHQTARPGQQPPSLIAEGVSSLPEKASPAAAVKEAIGPVSSILKRCSAGTLTNVAGAFGRKPTASDLGALKLTLDSPRYSRQLAKVVVFSVSSPLVNSRLMHAA